MQDPNCIKAERCRDRSPLTHIYEHLLLEVEELLDISIQKDSSS